MREFTQKRMTASSRSFSETGRTLDGSNSRVAECDAVAGQAISFVACLKLVSDIAGVPPVRRVQSGEMPGSDRYESLTSAELVRSENSVLEVESKSEEGTLRPEDGSPALPQRRTHSFNASTPVGRNPIGTTVSAVEHAADTQEDPFGAFSSEYSRPPIHSFCTMSEYGGGIPSPLTIEICAFVSKIDQFSAAWHRWALLGVIYDVILMIFCSHKLAAIDKMVRY
jgi:hypothetical protein